MYKLKLISALFLVILLVAFGAMIWMYLDIQGQMQALKHMEPKTTRIERVIEKPKQTVGAGTLADSKTLEQQLIAVIAKVSPSVVNIVISKNLQIYMADPFDFRGMGQITQEKRQVGGGSGILVTKDGLIITNKHVVSDINAEYSVVLNDGTVYTAQQVRFDPLIDIAILQIVDKDGKKPTGLIPASFLDFGQEVQIGQFALAIGNALAEYQNSVSFGIISATNRQLDATNEKNLYVGLYQTDTSINPGNSGGPLLDLNGHVMGITTAINAAGAGLGFALPINQQFVDATIRSIQTVGQIQRPFLGVGYVDLNRKLSEELKLSVPAGAYIKQVITDSPAAKAGVLEGDIITAINDRPVTKTLPFLYHIYQYTTDDNLTISVLRGTEKKELTASLTGQ